ncbi:hypothetical protein SCD_n00327 [Sulfuricella denitrificans skB26]|uniref:Uncharacterized protein n=1 Tax=Sulfuricella denitrificans (strain DSM 22764 / NBRC 105220 / skB26) TaxID=1163617 RepID=S6AEH3_SULDS|nr:hypothetical protein [Sulfuricella denitrificans]BAN34176.1 hypothetical protein SCD_n00327 [Sulfuricella denitrificans skB26]
MFDLLKFFHRKEAGLLEGVLGAGAWPSEQNSQNECDFLKALVDALTAFGAKGAPYSRERLKTLMRLDECSQGLQHSLGRKYLEGADESALETAAGLSVQMANSYRGLCREIVAGRDGGGGRKYLPLVVARTLNHLGAAVKWGYFRQEKVPSAMWERLHKFYLLAESAGFAGAQIRLASGRLTTCADEYVHILLLDMVRPTSLKPFQIGLVAGWLEEWAPLVRLEKSCDTGSHMHCVDLMSGSAAKRLVEGMNGDNLRCWGMADLYVHIRKLRFELAQGDAVDRLQVEGVPATMQDYKLLLDYLSKHWIRPKNARNQERIASGSKVVEMACGVEAVRTCLHSGAAGKSRDEECALIEHWAVENESGSGYGLLEGKPPEKPEFGKLVCVKQAGDTGKWEVGVVRWKKESSGPPALGIEKLSEDPKHVELCLADKAGNMRIRAVFLPKWYDREVDSSLILQAPDYAANSLLDMYYRNNVFRIRLTEVVDVTEEWVRVKFDLQGRRTGKMV